MIFDRALRKAAQPTIVSGLGLRTLEGWDDTERIALSRDAAMKQSTVNRCVEVISNSIASLPVYIMDETTKERMPRHALGRVLWGRPNEAMTFFDFEKLMECNRLLRGNAFAWIRRDERTAVVTELIPLDPERVEIVIDDAGSLWYLWCHPRSGARYKLSPADILHYKACTRDGITGVSILERAASTIRTSLSAGSTQEDLYANGGRPSGVLTLATDLSGSVTRTDADGNEETVSKKELIRREWEKIHAGRGKAFRVAVLDNGMDYKPIALSNADAQFVQSEELRVSDICRFFGVPLHLAYAGKQSYSSNEQNSIEFVRYTLQAAVTAREQEDTWKLLLPVEREAGLRVRREMKVFLRGDTAAQSAWYKAMRDIGVYSVNDIRGLEDMGAVPGGDSRQASLNYVPLEDFRELSRRRNGIGKQNE